FTGAIAAARDPVGKGQREGSSEVMLLGLGVFDLETATPSARELACRFGARRLVGTPTPPAQLKVRIIAAEAPLGQQHGDVGGRGPEAAIARVEQHVCETQVR